MKFNLFKKITDIEKNYTTYAVGLLQDKAYRILKSHTALLLKEFDISTNDWALLGYLSGEDQGVRPSVLSYILGVEAPFITTQVTHLEKKGYVTSGIDKDDTRAKRIILTKSGMLFVEKTEKYLREGTKPLLEGIPALDIYKYIKVLRGIISNGIKD